jgi:ribosomal protein L11 methylase PrmA
MKKCSKCGEWKQISEFYKDRSKKDGLDYQCKNCKKEYLQINKEKRNESSRKYYENNKKYYKEWKKKYMKDINNCKRSTIGASLNKHRKRGNDVIVTIDECMQMNNDYCFYCGCKLEWAHGTGHSSRSPTIDRRDNENMLTKDNIVFACYACNAGKHNDTTDEYIARCKRVSANESNIIRK